MARSYFCPRCLHDVTAEQVIYVDRAGVRTEKPQLVYDRTPTDWLKAVWNGDPGGLYRVHPRVRADVDARGVHGRCPNGHRIPADAFELDSVVAAMVGEKAAGKTVYLATLLDQLAHRRLMPWVDFELDEESEDLQQENFGPFYADGSPPFPTTVNQDDFGRAGFMMTARNPTEDFHLTVFDTSGEQNRRSDHGRHNQYLYDADIVLFFVTPQALGLQPRSPEHRPDQLQTWHETNALVQGVVGVARESVKHAAVMVVKSDDIHPDELDPLVRDARDDLAYGERLSLLRAVQVIEQDSAYVGAFLKSFENGRTLAAQIEAAVGSVSYHLVSATGKPIDRSVGRFVRPVPHRVLDPLLYSLVRIGRLDRDAGRLA